MFKVGDILELTNQYDDDGKPEKWLYCEYKNGRSWGYKLNDPSKFERSIYLGQDTTFRLYKRGLTKTNKPVWF